MTKLFIFSLILFTQIHPASAQTNSSLSGSWEGAGIRVSQSSYGRNETLFNSRMIIDSVTDKYIIGRIAYVIQEYSYTSCCFSFKAYSTGNDYIGEAKDFIPYPSNSDNGLCNGFDNGDCFQQIHISKTNEGLIVGLKSSPNISCTGKLYFFKTDADNAAEINQNKKIYELYEAWKKPLPKEKEKQTTERIEKWYNQRELYSLTTRTQMLDKSDFSYRYYPSDSLLIVKLANVVPVPFKIVPLDFESLDLEYINSLKINNAFFQSQDIDSDYGLNGVWLINGMFDDLIPKKKIYYPNQQQYDNNVNITQTKFSEKIVNQPISLKKVEDEMIFGSVNWIEAGTTYQITNNDALNKQNKEASDVLLTSIDLSTDINELAACKKLVESGKSQSEKEELQKDYWILLGIVDDLGKYRQAFFKDGKLINLFPTAYYHTTVSEMKRIINLEFTYPIEKMKQMIAFYDAYKFNRENWDIGNKSIVEPHWLSYYDLATSSITEIDLLCSRIGHVLAAGITAHAKIDLGRAIRYTYTNRYNNAILKNDKLFEKDFNATDDIFDNSVIKTIHDVSLARNCDELKLLNISTGQGAFSFAIDLNNFVYHIPIFDYLFSPEKILTSKDVKNIRHESWKNGMDVKELKGQNNVSLLSQPIINHFPLLEVGKKICPPIDDLEKNTFTINPKDVTLPGDKEFKWYEWDKAPEDIKIATKFSYTYSKDKTLRQKIEKYLSVENTTVEIAALDLDEDGVCGLAIFVSGNAYCGSKGCTFELYENGGLKMYELGTDYSVSPSKKGILTSTNRFVPVTSNKIITVSAIDQKNTTTLFTYDKTKANNNSGSGVAIPPNFLGGSTPEELGKLMLKALQTNNKALWASCVHPTYEMISNPEKRQQTIDEFNKIRDDFESLGISDWSKVSFSRVTFQRCDQCAPPGEKWLRELLVEFWYKGKEFIAVVSFTPVITYKGKYFVGRNYMHNLKRMK